MIESPELEGISSDADLKNLVTLALNRAKELGATEAAAEVSEEKGCMVAVRNFEPESIEHTHDRNFSVTVYLGKASGTASCGDFRPEAIEKSVKAAADIARYTAEDDCAGLPDPESLCAQPLDLDLCVPWNISVEEMIERAAEAERAAFDTDERIQNSEGSSLSTSSGRFVLGNTHGFLAGYPFSNQSADVTVIAEDDEGMQTGSRYCVGNAASDLFPAVELGRTAAQRAVARLGARGLSPRTCPVIFEAPLARSLINYFIKAASGSSLYRKSSFLKGEMGEEVFPEFLSLFENPFIKGAYASAPFDDEGVRPSERIVVDRGRLKGLFLTSYSARKLGKKTTGNAGGPYNMFLNAEASYREKGLAELGRRMGEGLIVTDLIGQGVNPATGDFSKGASGFWVENGAVQYPVEGITVAGNLKDMFLGIRAFGEDIDKNGSVCCGSILIDEIAVAGNG